MKELVNYIAKALVDEPQEVMVSEITSSQMRVLEVQVAKSDLGKIIGRQGRTAHAVRTIVHAISCKTKQKTILHIIE